MPKERHFTCRKCDKAKPEGCRASVTEDGPLCFDCDWSKVRCMDCQAVVPTTQGAWRKRSDGDGREMVCLSCAATPRRPAKQTALAQALAALDRGEFYLDDVLDHAAKREGRATFARLLLDRLTAQELDAELATRRVSATEADGTQAAQLALAFNSRQ
jgi:hypothetical protein